MILEKRKSKDAKEEVKAASHIVRHFSDKREMKIEESTLNSRAFTLFFKIGAISLSHFWRGFLAATGY